jgi:hypothetical protein
MRSGRLAGLLIVAILIVLVSGATTRALLNLHLQTALHQVLTFGERLTFPGDSVGQDAQLNIGAQSPVYWGRTSLADLAAQRPDDWRVQLVLARWAEPTDSEAQAASRRSQHANQAFGKAISLGPNEILPRASFVAWAFSSAYLSSFRPEEMPPEERAAAPEPRLPDPEAAEQVASQLAELKKLDPDNGVWHIAQAQLDFALLHDEEGLAELRAGLSKPRFKLYAAREVEVLASVLQLTGIPRLEAEQEAMRTSSFSRLIDCERLTRVVCALAEDRWHAGRREDAVAILTMAVELCARGRSNAPTVAGSLSACKAALVQQALVSLGLLSVTPDTRLPGRVDESPAVYLPNGLAQALDAELAAENDLVARVRRARSDPDTDWNKWNATWSRASSLSSGTILFLEQAWIWGFLWFVATVIYLFIKRTRLSTLPTSWRAVASLLLVTMVPPVFFVSRILRHDFSLPWSKAFEHSILVPDPSQFTIVNAFYLTLIPAVVCSVLCAGWRCRRHKVESTGFWPELVSLLKVALPIAVAVALLGYGISLVYLVGIRAESQAMMESFLRHGEHIFLR